LKRLVVLNQAVVMLGTVTQLLAITRSEPLTKRKIAESLLGWSLPLNLGVLEILWFVRHFHNLRREGTTESEGQPTANRVRSELAVAHLALGVLGLLAIRFRGMFWFATVVGQAVFLVGVVAVNARDILKDKMHFFDLLMSLAHIGLLKAYDPLGATRPPAPRWRRWLGVRR
jgi:hypothetical protein